MIANFVLLLALNTATAGIPQEIIDALNRGVTLVKVLSYEENGDEKVVGIFLAEPFVVTTIVHRFIAGWKFTKEDILFVMREVDGEAKVIWQNPLVSSPP